MLVQRQSTELSNDVLKRIAPSIFAVAPWHERTDQYKFVPTINVIDAMRDYGYKPVWVNQSNSRIEGKREFTKHMIRFRAAEDMASIQVKAALPEVVLINSHDGTSSYKMMLGIFRMVCGNGMIVADKMMDSFSVRHIGDRDLCQNVIDVSGRVIADAPRALESVNRMEQVLLSQPDQIDFSRRAIAANESTIEIEPERLLRIRRSADRPADNGTRTLWQTLNTVQENLIRGGILGRGSNGYYRRTRAIKSIDKDVNLNRKLWNIADEMAVLRGEMPKARRTPEIIIDVKPQTQFERAKALMVKYGNDWMNHIKEM